VTLPPSLPPISYSPSVSFSRSPSDPSCLHCAQRATRPGREAADRYSLVLLNLPCSLALSSAHPRQPSPTPSPTDPVPRRQLWPTGPIYSQYTAYIQPIYSLYTAYIQPIERGACGMQGRARAKTAQRAPPAFLPSTPARSLPLLPRQHALSLYLSPLSGIIFTRAQ